MTSALAKAIYFDPIAGASVEANNQIITQLTGREGGVLACCQTVLEGFDNPFMLDLAWIWPSFLVSRCLSLATIVAHLICKIMI